MPKPLPQLALLILLLSPLPGLAQQTQAAQGMYQDNIWLDDSVSYLANQLDAGANWFDSFFGDKRDTEETRASLYARWVQDFLFDQSDSFEYDTKFRAQAELPRFSRHMKLLIGDDDDDRVDDLRANQEEIEDTNANAQLGLRYDLKSKEKSRLSLTGSLRLSPFTPRLKLRHRKGWVTSPTTLARLTSTGYWDADDGFSARLTGDLEKSLDHSAMLRWVNSVEWAEDQQQEDGLNWLSQLTHFEKFSTDKALALDVGVFGVTKPQFEPENYRIRARFRSGFLRPWLFYELQPEIYWPQDERKEECDTCLAMMFRLEIQFRKEEAQPQDATDKAEAAALSPNPDKLPRL